MSRTITLATCLALFGLAGTAEAHFRLNAPASLSQQNAPYGDPQKNHPCGPPAATPMPTNAVTEVRSGSMLSISIIETIYHPGFYRVALAQTAAGLPPELPMNATDASCNGLNPVANPTMPVLADGLLPHSAQFPSPTQTMQVMIPDGMTCTNCVLQVMQYMRNHGRPCYYYHCATVNISPNAPPPPDGGINPMPDADPGTDPGEEPVGGCCSAGRDSAVTGLLGGLAVGVLALRRRRRR